VSVLEIRFGFPLFFVFSFVFSNALYSTGPSYVNLSVAVPHPSTPRLLPVVLRTWPLSIYTFYLWMFACFEFLGNFPPPSVRGCKTPFFFPLSFADLVHPSFYGCLPDPSVQSLRPLLIGGFFYNIHLENIPSSLSNNTKNSVFGIVLYPFMSLFAFFV